MENFELFPRTGMKRFYYQIAIISCIEEEKIYHPTTLKSRFNYAMYDVYRKLKKFKF